MEILKDYIILTEKEAKDFINGRLKVPEDKTIKVEAIHSIQKPKKDYILFQGLKERYY